MVDVPAGNYTIQASGVSGSAGIALVEVYDLSPATSAVVTVAATRPVYDGHRARQPASDPGSG